MSKLATITQGELLAEWERLDVMRQTVAYPPAPKNSFTANEYAERYGIGSTQTAARQLDRLEKAGKLKSSKALKNRVVRVYWIP
jgi:hypothetical protein